MEKNPYSISAESEAEVLDKKWFDRFSKLIDFEDYKLFEGDGQRRSELRAAFLAGETDRPELDYPKLDYRVIEEKEQALKALQEQIELEEDNELVKQAYVGRILEKRAMARMLMATAVGDQNRFVKYSEYIYGKPEQETFNHTINELRELCYSVESGSPAGEVAQTLLQRFENVSDKTSVQPPGSAVQAKNRRAVLQEFDTILSLGGSYGETLSAQAVKVTFELALERMNIKDWSVEIKDVDNASVNPARKIVTVPEKRDTTLDRVRKLIVHELGTHAKRQQQGQRSKLQLFQLGTRDYDRGEEGVATMREQALNTSEDNFTYSGFPGYFAAGLAYGLHGKALDFRGVYEVLCDYYLLKELKAGKSETEAKSKAEDDAWKRTVRTFRGTNGEAGACYTKDIVYREGEIDAWKKAEEDPDFFLKTSLAKINHGNPRDEYYMWHMVDIDKLTQLLKEDDYQATGSN